MWRQWNQWPNSKEEAKSTSSPQLPHSSLEAQVKKLESTSLLDLLAIENEMPSEHRPVGKVQQANKNQLWAIYPVLSQESSQAFLLALLTT